MSPRLPNVALRAIDVDAAITLGGAVVERAEGAVIVVDREYRADMLHGRTPIGEIVSTINEGADAMKLMARGVAVGEGHRRSRRRTVPPCCSSISKPPACSAAPARRRFSSAARRSTATSIRVRQFLLPGFEHERAVLGEVQSWAKSARRAGHLQRPQLRRAADRNAVHVPSRCRARSTACRTSTCCTRRGGCGGSGRSTTGTPDPDDSSCSLAVLEKHIAGLHRIGDVPGYEIPSRFFQFVRDGDARPLEAVLEHNRLDLISLAAVLARAITLITRGPGEAAHGAGSLRPGARLRARRRARQRGSVVAADDRLRQARRRRAGSARRSASAPGVDSPARRAACTKPPRRGASWRSLPRCAASLRREAKEALAIHHEHRSKDLQAARQHALDLLRDCDANHGARPHRLDRLERKIARYTATLPLHD